MDDKTKTLEKSPLKKNSMAPSNQAVGTGIPVTVKKKFTPGLGATIQKTKVITKPLKPGALTQKPKVVAAAIKPIVPNKKKEDKLSRDAADQQKSREAWRVKRKILKSLMSTLKANHPTPFNPKDLKPLALGIHKEVFSQYPQYSRKLIRIAIIQWVRNPKYRDQLVLGTTRYNLSGLPAGKVIELEVPIENKIPENKQPTADIQNVHEQGDHVIFHQKTMSTC